MLNLLCISVVTFAASLAGDSSKDGAPEPVSEALWTADSLSRYTGTLVDELAVLRAEVAWLRRKAAEPTHMKQADAASPAFGQVPNANHGRTLFLTMCAGTSYFIIHCGPLLASYERAYRSAALKHHVVVFISHVNPELVEVARERFAPWITFVAAPHEEQQGATYGVDAELQGGALKCEASAGNHRKCMMTEEGVANRDEKTQLDSFYFPKFASEYLKQHGPNYEYAVVMDSDMLFVQPIGHYLPASGSSTEQPFVADWDVAFTAYDPLFVVPWAEEAATVGRTKKGFNRLNCGVILLNLQHLDVIVRFLVKWAVVSLLLQVGDTSGAGSSGSVWQAWHEELTEDFRGNDQAGLALLISEYDPGRLRTLLGWSACKVCFEAIHVQLQLFEGESSLPVRFRAFPARVLNHAESMLNGTFPPEVLIVHLKGAWWRMAVSKGVFLVDATRRPTWNRDALVLHQNLFRTWMYSLPDAFKVRAFEDSLA